jgi:hypothetical protein
VEATAIVEFSGLCRVNPVRLSKELGVVGARVVSHDVSSGVVVATLRLNLLNPGDAESRARFLAEVVSRELLGCRAWVKVVTSGDLWGLLSRFTVARLSSAEGTVYVVRLPVYYYAVQRSTRGPPRLRLVPIARSESSYYGDLSGLTFPCEGAVEYLTGVLKDLRGVLGSGGDIP